MLQIHTQMPRGRLLIKIYRYLASRTPAMSSRGMLEVRLQRTACKPVTVGARNGSTKILPAHAAPGFCTRIPMAQSSVASLKSVTCAGLRNSREQRSSWESRASHNVKGLTAREIKDSSQSQVSVTFHVLRHLAPHTNAVTSSLDGQPQRLQGPNQQLRLQQSVRILVVGCGVITEVPGSPSKIVTLMGSMTWFVMTGMVALGPDRALGPALITLPLRVLTLPWKRPWPSCPQLPLQDPRGVLILVVRLGAGIEVLSVGGIVTLMDSWTCIARQFLVAVTSG